MNKKIIKPLLGGKWADSLFCNWCQKRMGDPLAVCQNCGNHQDSNDSFQKTDKSVEPPKLTRAGSFGD
jgi:hypothetical protein